ncbi:hypothetical protein [Gracilibacillus sp. YIM 98692]|uniref:hypothetical protein n=1 Tax=Gracilibacillus sp. YIM 98692 TaxID=2663532 RepID=UPI0013CF8C7C|nr:hypothetical protein [Gracilibacillus sp. YIM 98692]
MFHQVKLNLYYFFKTSWMTILSFWFIFLASVLVLLIMTVSLGGEMEFSGFNTFPSLIFTMIYGSIFFRETFPHVIKFGLSRLSYTISLVIYLFLFAIVMIILSQLVIQFIGLIIDLFAIENFQFIGINQMSNGLTNIGEWDLIIYEAMLYFLVFGISLLISSVFFRFGFKLGAVLFIPVIALFFFQSIAENIFKGLSYLGIGHANYTVYAFIVPLAMIAILLWLLTKNASVIDKVSNK